MYLGDGKVGVLGHVARFSDDGARHYYPAAFTIDTVSGNASLWRILIERSLLPSGEAKRPDLQDVLFPGGILRKPDGTALLYLGVSDAETMACVIPDPFA
jgi:hypothetical protein